MAKGKKSGLVEKSENDIEKQPVKKETVVETPIVEEEKKEEKVNPHTIGKMR